MKRIKKLAAICIFILGLSLAARAEIEKKSLMCDTGICLYWWPKLPELQGWHQEEGASYAIEANALVPDGHTFKNASSVIYAKALYKPRIPETKSVATLIADDKEEFLSSDPSLIITEVAALTTGDGKKLRSFTFFPKSQGNCWEQVSYGEEGDFYLIFALSTNSKKAFDETQATFRQLVTRYKEAPSESARNR